ncbi:hypothetical protein SS50377_23273 [Spironucleus salmonicida]|uniref:CEP76/DRC7 peptidase-like domain-containing protein n=1 Tax=Spironucleus salmonicida TaxID=348837 RepID=A0A9P8LWL6_9EUKA|nr:hypothetical protein SS50377_23273 [Spironucleus salmonicida]
MQRIEQIQTRTGQLSAESSINEQERMQQMTTRQKRAYLKKYSIRQSYEQRGITLFVNNVKGDQVFINQLLPSEIQTQKLILQFSIKKIDDCIAFAASVPFIPDTLVRYYTEQQLGSFQLETRMSLDQVFSVCGGDYFEHAMLLQALLSGCGYQAFVARLCTQVLVNEYYVLLVNDGSQVLIDPVSTIQYSLISPFLTKLILVFDNSRIIVSRQIDMRPSVTEFEFKDPESWVSLPIQTIQGNIELADMLLPTLPKALESLQQQLKEAVRQFICDSRDQKITKFNDSVANALEQGDFGVLDQYNTTLLEIRTAWEDSAVLMEKIQNSAITETDSRYCEFVIALKVRGFGSKFGFIELILARLMPKLAGKESAKKGVKLLGSKFGHGQ